MDLKAFSPSSAKPCSRGRSGISGIEDLVLLSYDIKMKHVSIRGPITESIDGAFCLIKGGRNTTARIVNSIRGRSGPSFPFSAQRFA